jgi:heptosyltransferase-2
MLPKKILISLPNWLGDIVMSLPTIKAMRWLFPESHISVLVRSNFASLFKYNHDINEVIVYQRGEKLKKFISGWKIAKTIREKNFDTALILPRSFNSALIPFLSKIPRRIGYAADTRSILLTNPIQRKKELLTQHRVYYFLNLLNDFGKSVVMSAPIIKTGKEEEKWADGLLKPALGGHLASRTFWIGFNAGATYGEAKCWFPERYAELGRKLIDKFNAYILLFGSKAETQTNVEISKKLPKERVLDISGQTDIIQLATLLKRCRFLVTNDTGPMHVAAAVAKPVVAVFGPTDYVTTAPFGSNHIIIRKEVACSPCLERTCPTDNRCMKAVTVDDVFDACLKITHKQ